ncbi:MAG TPA: EB domain-containing protein [Polyangiales bacterium]|nr:EB domain-containing protein [Polyangiales bacterium]
MKIWPLFAVLLLVACADSERSPLVSGGGDGPDANLCTDEDGDGYGDGCAQGGDCNDEDPAIHRGCLTCSRPAEGCLCESSSKPVSCYLDPSFGNEGAVMCHEGTRYCRNGTWSGCESIFTYPKPDASTPTQAVISSDAGLEKCSDCRPNCYIVRDNLNPIDGGLGGSGTNTTIGDGGSLGLGTYISDAGMDASATWDASGCVAGSAPDKDCDGILDQYDPYPTMKPFATTNPSLFLDVAPGGSATGAIDLKFNLSSVDVYFLVDQTTTMTGERDNLKAGLVTGDFVNDAAYNCADDDFNGLPNNNHKNEGITGAIRCYIRDANFGVGYFRELPFSSAYGDTTEIAFRNLQDITTDIKPDGGLDRAVGSLNTDANKDYDEDAVPALYSLITGNGMYFGTDRTSIPTRVGCPAGTWGYPCFRDGAIPIVLLFTDAATHNGPSPLTRSYTSGNLGISKTNTAASITTVSGNESPTSGVIDAADVTNSYVSFAGDTTNMAANSSAQFTCGTTSSPDAFFKFSLSSSKSVTITTEGTDAAEDHKVAFDTVLGVWSGIPTSPTATATTPSGNDGASSAFSFNDVGNKYLTTSGSTTGLKSDYLAADLGCSAYNTSADAAFTFSLTAPTKIALDTSGSTIGTSLSLFSGTFAPPTYETGTVNTNDTIGTIKDIGPINGLMKAFNGSTNTFSLAANQYTSGQLGCGYADSASDAVYQFSVSGTTNRRVRISSDGSSLNTVLSLTDVAPLYPLLTYGSNDKEASNPSTIALNGQAYAISTDTSGSYNTDYNATGGTPYYDPAGGCGAGGRDALYKFSLASAATVKIDAISSVFDTTLALFRSSITPSAVTSVTSLASYDSVASAYSGAITGARHTVSSSTTSSMVSDYNAANVQTSSTTCNAATGSPDAVYKMTFTGPTKLKLTTSGTNFDTVVSLHSNLPDINTSTPATSGDVVTASTTTSGAGSPPYAVGNITGKNISFTGTTVGYQSNVQVINSAFTCNANDAAPDAVYSFTVGTTGTYQIDTIGSSLDTVLGIFEQAKVATFPYPIPGVYPTNVIDLGIQGDRYDADGVTVSSVVSKQVDLGSVANTWKTWKGRYDVLADNTDQLSTAAGGSDPSKNCGADKNARDVWFKFSAPATAAGHVLRIDTFGSNYFGVLGLYRATATPTFVACANAGTPGDALTVTVPTLGGSWYVLLKGKTSSSPPTPTTPPATTPTTTPWNYYLSIRDLDSTAASPQMAACDDNSGDGSSTSKISMTLNAGTNYYAVVKGKIYDSDTFKITFKDTGWMSTTKFALACNDNDPAGGTNNSLLEYNIPAAGTYYAVVKGKTSGVGGYGSYTLTMEDASGAAGYLTCNEDGTTFNSSITKTLAAGTYYAMVKGKNGASVTRGAVNVNIVDTAAGYTNIIDCNYTAGATGSSIEKDLSPGNYRVYVKGKNASEKNDYNLQVRDVTSLPLGSSRLNCDYQSGTGSKSYMETQLNAGTYTAILKGDNASGNYRLSVRDADKLGAESPVYCDDDSGTGVTSSLTKTLAAGTYYVGVKGKTATDKGQYQVHFGGGALTSSTYAPKTYTDVVAAMTAKKARVIPIISCGDDPTAAVQTDCPNAKTQYNALATATDSLDSALKPLVFDIKSDGTGLSKTVVNAVNSLAHYLEMDVGVRVVFSPDANPGFGLVVKAVDTTGDGCKPPVNEVHQDCTPGATPRFEITFSNPLATPVPINPNDPKGGYSFRAELIGNDQFIVDQVPIYVVPKAVVNVPVPTVYPSGSYSQNLAGGACAGKTELPDWNELTWNATIPNGTSVSFSGCGAGTVAGLATCTATPICTITGGAACDASVPCPTGSLCSTGGNCWKITGATCTTNSQCKAGATCMAGTCVWANQPLDVGDVLGEQNYQPNLRVQIGLTANTALNVGPTVHDWQLSYLCKSAL